ncbi:MAG: single-stranded DNA-binding protein [Verrucomicrobia bacterium]|nr:MAG: single-stranded DNA-binding protein [Verrucomicrobiota bacterium]
MARSDLLIGAAERLRDAVETLKFSAPVAHVYNPLVYAWRAHEIYLRRYGNGRKRVLFLGMNPGPFGMAQTGIPFGEIAAVRDWLGIRATIERPPDEHPKRPVMGFNCARTEISGQRLWGLFAKRFGSADKFFEEHLVMNYCPLAFVEKSGRNRTPDKLPGNERTALFEACDEHLREIVRILEPEWLIGLGDFAAKRARAVIADPLPRIGQILHPSPACPASNNDWAGTATSQLHALGVWKGHTDPPNAKSRQSKRKHLDF